MIKVQNLAFSYTKKEYMTNINFDVKDGEIFGFLGPSGAGKSTLQKILTGVLSNYSGSVIVNDYEVKNANTDFYENIGVDFEFPSLYAKMSGEDNLKFFSSLYKKTLNPLELLEKVGLQFDASKKVSEYSKGMKSRLNFIKALVHNPKTLFLDEPTSGLDPVFRDEFLDMLLNIVQDEEKTILFSTHITSDLDKIADYITYIHNGKIVFSKERDQIYENYYLIKGSLEKLKNQEKLFIGIKKNKYGFEALTNNKKLVENQFGNDIIIERANLEDIMVYYNKMEVV